MTQINSLLSSLKRRHALLALREPIWRGIAAPHDNMPQFQLTTEQTDAVIAYINSLPKQN